MKKSLDRFLIAQQNYYYDAYTELKAGKREAIGCVSYFPRFVASDTVIWRNISP